MRFRELHSYTHTQLLSFLIILSIIFLMLGNGALSLTHPDEVFYIQTAKEMLQKHNWLTPYIFDAPQFEKPIFSYWLFMVAVKIFGLNAFAGRFFPAVFGMLAVAAVYGISWVLFKSKRLSFLAGLILMSSIIHVALSRAVLTDMIFSVWVTLSVGAFCWGYTDQRFKDKGIILSLIFSGIAILTKGLLGFCFPAGTAILFLLIKKDLKFLRSWSVLWGFLLLLLIALPWHILMYKLYGQAFIHEYFYNDHVRRLLEAEHQKSNTWYFYPLTVAGGVMPWTFFIASALGVFVCKIKAKGKDSSSLLFLLSWLIGIFAFVQPAQSKLASYILPIFPTVTIILAYYLEKALFTEISVLKVGFKRAGYVAGVVLAIAGVAVLIAAKKFGAYVSSCGAGYFASLSFFILALIIFINLRRENFCKVVGILCMVPLVLIGVCACVISAAEPWVSCKDVSARLLKVDHAGTTILTSKFYVRGVRYYTNLPVAVIDIGGKQFFSPHPIPFLNSDLQVRDFLNSQPVTFCVVKKSNVEDLERIICNSHFSLVHIYDVGGKAILKIEKMK